MFFDCEGEIVFILSKYVFMSKDLSNVFECVKIIIICENIIVYSFDLQQ